MDAYRSMRLIVCGSREKIEKKIVLPYCTPSGRTSGSSVYVTRGEGANRRNYTLQYWWTGSILFTAGRDFVNWKTSARTNKSAALYPLVGVSPKVPSRFGTTRRTQCWNTFSHIMPGRKQKHTHTCVYVWRKVALVIIHG